VSLCEEANLFKERLLLVLQAGVFHCLTQKGVASISDWFLSGGYHSILFPLDYSGLGVTSHC
jgi:hypothetical protein